jgi:predicted metal-dependent hydrolase
MPTHRKPAISGTYKTTLNGQIVSYNVKRSSRVKYARLEVRVGAGLTVVIPDSYNTNDISDLLRKKGSWILDKLAKYVTGHPTTNRKEPENGDFIPYLGRRLKVVTRYNPDVAAGVKLEKNRLLVNLVSRKNKLNLVLEWWYRQQAEKVVKKRADELCPELVVTYNRLTIRGAKTRWGSCSQKGNLNFNWKLMMVPEPVLDYVIIHELAHMKELNHSKNFWKLVAEHCPQWRKHRKWLKAHEAEFSAVLRG